MVKKYCLLYFFLVLSGVTFSQVADSTRADSINPGRKIYPQGDVKEKNILDTGYDLEESDFPGSWPMFGSKLRMKVGGYVKIDALYDINGTLDRTQFLMATIPVKGQPEYDDHGYFYFFARETRINVEARRVGNGKVPLKLFVEGDFWSDGNRFRLRHAFITAGDFLIGQTWTTLSVLESLVFMIDFGAGDALFGGRTAQVRYQKQLSDHVKMSLAIENMDYLGIDNPDTMPGKASAQLPLFAARFDFSWKSGVLILGSSVGQLRWDGGADGTSKSMQIDAVIAGRQYIGKNNFFTWNFSGGLGSGENIMAFIGSDANAVLNPDMSLKTMPAIALVVGFQHKWSETFSSNISYAYGWLDTPPTRDPYSLKEGGVGHLNLIYMPKNRLKGFSTGVEYIYGAQRTTNNAYGNASRIQAMAKYQF